jgi:hypothetical protein
VVNKLAIPVSAQSHGNTESELVEVVTGEPRWGRTIGPLIKSQMLYR